jgi:nicotinamide riboside transporter PnuC
MAKRKVGVGLVVMAYGLLLYISLAAPSYARAHPHLDRALLAQYASPWPVALGCTVAMSGIVLALVPIRYGERWAVWTSLAMLIVLLATRFASDPRCLVVLDPHQHGCHSFMIAVVLGIVGLSLAGARQLPR